MLATSAVGSWQLLASATRDGIRSWWRPLLSNQSSLRISAGLYAAAVGLAVGALLIHQLGLISTGSTAYEARRRGRRPATSASSNSRGSLDAVDAQAGGAQAVDAQAGGARAGCTDHAGLAVAQEIDGEIDGEIDREINGPVEADNWGTAAEAAHLAPVRSSVGDGGPEERTQRETVPPMMCGATCWSDHWRCFTHQTAPLGLTLWVAMTVWAPPACVPDQDSDGGDARRR